MARVLDWTAKTALNYCFDVHSNNRTVELAVIQLAFYLKKIKMKIPFVKAFIFAIFNSMKQIIYLQIMIENKN